MLASCSSYALGLPPSDTATRASVGLGGPSTPSTSSTHSDKKKMQRRYDTNSTLSPLSFQRTQKALGSSNRHCSKQWGHYLLPFASNSNTKSKEGKAFHFPGAVEIIRSLVHGIYTGGSQPA